MTLKQLPLYLGPGTTITSDAPQDFGNAKGFNDAEYAGRYLIAESIPDSQLRSFIVNACNNFYPMLDALQACADVLDGQYGWHCSPLKEAREAIINAKGSV